MQILTEDFVCTGFVSCTGLSPTSLQHVSSDGLELDIENEHSVADTQTSQIHNSASPHKWQLFGDPKQVKRSNIVYFCVHFRAVSFHWMEDLEKRLLSLFHDFLFSDCHCFPTLTLSFHFLL